MDGGGDGRSLLTMLGLGVLTCNSALAVYRSWGDVASVVFVVAANASLLLLLHFLRRFERARPGDDDRRKAKAAVWALTTLLTAMLGAHHAALVLLFVCLREFERRRGRYKAAVWALTTLLTAMLAYASGVAPPVVVGGALVLLCLGEFERAQIGLGGQYADLFKMGFGVTVCSFALAHHHARGDAGSMAFVFFAYLAFVTHTWFFLRRFDGRARGAGAGQ